MSSMIKARKNPAISPSNMLIRSWRIVSLVQYTLFLFLLHGCPRRAAAQTPVQLSPVANQQFFSAAGVPLAGGALFTFAAGTTTPLATYTDGTGLAVAPYPIILNAGGFPPTGGPWIQDTGYKFVLCAAGTGGSGTCAGYGALQWTIDLIIPPPSLNGNNAWTGNETHGGTETFNAAIILNGGGSMSGNFSGNPTFGGNPQFTGTVTFTMPVIFSGGIDTDLIQGITPGGTLNALGAIGVSATPNGENVNIAAGVATTTGSGGSVTATAGGGGTTGGSGGGMNFGTGAANAGNNNGGDFDILTGNGFGTAHAGAVNIGGGTGGGAGGAGATFTLAAGAGGGGSGLGGNFSLKSGAGGAGNANSGSFSFGVGAPTGTGLYGNTNWLGGGHLMFTAPATAANPTIAAGCTGVGTGTCTILPYSTDTSGTIVLTPTGAPAAAGALAILFYNGMGTNSIYCNVTLQNNVITSGFWNSRATAFPEYAAGGFAAGTSVEIVWDNNAVNLAVGGATYMINYWCRGEN